MLDEKYVSAVAVQKIVGQKLPRIIFVAGKTCTGKTTFAREIKKYGYEQIELDQIVRKDVAQKFEIADQLEAFLVFKGTAPAKWQEAFETAARIFILEKLKKSKIVIDGAIADTEVLKRILAGHLSDLEVVYFHPFTAEEYFRRLAARLAEDIGTGLHTIPVWHMVGEGVVEDYRKSGLNAKKFVDVVQRYGRDSIKRSEERYKLFKSNFPKVTLVGF